MTRPLAVAILTAGMSISPHILASEQATPSPADILNQWAQLIVYAVTPYCQVLANGLRVCQPIGIVGPAPGSTPTYQPLMPIPLAPPYLQAPWPQPATLPPLSYPPHLTPGVIFPHPAQTTDSRPETAAVAQAAADNASPQLPPSPSQPPIDPNNTPLVDSPRPSAVEATPYEAAHQALPQTEPEQASRTAVVAATPLADTRSIDAQTPAIEPLVTPTQMDIPPVTRAAVPITTGRGVTTYFAFDDARLSEESRAALNAWLSTGDKERKIIIIGHADRLGPEPYNVALSRRRAEAVRAYLIEKGVDAKRITIVAKGETQPIIHCKGGATPQTIACLGPNRRVEITP